MGPAAPRADELPASVVGAAVRGQRDWMVELLLRLLAEPSVPGNEGPVQRLVEEAMLDLGLDAESVELDDDALRRHPLAAPFDSDLAGKRNVIGEWRPDGPCDGRSLTLSSHVDVPSP